MNRLPFDKALRAALETSIGKPVGLYGLPLVAAPTTAEPDRKTAPETPYFVLYALGSSASGPPFGDDHADAEWTYQLTCVGARGDQAMWARDKGFTAMVGRTADPQTFAMPVTVPGMTVTRRRAEDDGPMDDADGVVSYPQRYTFTVTPA